MTPEQKILIAGMTTAPGYQTLVDHISKQIENTMNELMSEPQSDNAKVNHLLGELKGMRFILNSITSAVNSIKREGNV